MQYPELMSHTANQLYDQQSPTNAATLCKIFYSCFILDTCDLLQPSFSEEYNSLFFFQPGFLFYTGKRHFICTFCL